ncbi:MAG: GNAT family N-acetyltransferase [Mycobacteriales bacterium]
MSERLSLLDRGEHFSPDGVRAAAASAAAAASRAGVVVRVVDCHADARAAAEVFMRVWQHPQGASAATPELCWALAHGGNYVSVAEREGKVIGASLAFRACDGVGNYLHSHLAAIDPDAQCAGIGYALKLHQRAWALDAGLDRVTWTFDPLVSRNAYFNVMKLGAEVDRFYPDFYGPLQDRINGGEDSDRCLAVWEVASARAAAASAGTLAAVEVEELLRGQATILLEPHPEDARPVWDERAPTEPLVLLRVPADIQSMREQAPLQARAWRLALRSVLQRLFDSGYVMSGATRASWYLFTNS